MKKSILVYVNFNNDPIFKVYKQNQCFGSYGQIKILNGLSVVDRFFITIFFFFAVLILKIFFCEI